MSVWAAPTGGDVAPRPTSRRVTAAGSAPASSRTTTCGFEVGAQREHAVGPHPRDPPVVLERADDPADAEADLAAVRDLRGEHRAGVQAERVRHPESDLYLVGPRIRRPSASGGSSKSVWSPG